MCVSTVSLTDFSIYSSHHSVSFNLYLNIHFHSNTSWKRAVTSPLTSSSTAALPVEPYDHCVFISGWLHRHTDEGWRGENEKDSPGCSIPLTLTFSCSAQRPYYIAPSTPATSGPAEARG